ncbi:MAG: hypothetical protein DRH17_00355 [Deltaproteobacteria bacterium]|nr:MAG: hypothetical protein DRH17_00355 [Deltaproteobacteria bacterium]
MKARRWEVGSCLVQKIWHIECDNNYGKALYSLFTRGPLSAMAPRTVAIILISGKKCLIFFRKFCNRPRS